MQPRTMRACHRLVFGFAVTGCTPHVEPPAPEAETKAVEAAAEPVVAEPTPVAVAPKGPESPARPEIVDVELTMHVVARGDVGLELYELVGGQVVLQLYEEIVLATTGGALVRDPSLRRGLDIPEGSDGDSTLSSIVGRWPDAAFVTVTADGSRELDGVHELYRWNNGWTKVENLEDGFTWEYDSIAPWHAGTLLGLRYYASSQDLFDVYEGADESESEDDEEPPAPPVVQFDVIGDGSHPAPRFGKDGVDAFDAIASGAVLGVRSGVALHWAPGRTRAKERKLPRRTPFYASVYGVELAASDRAWIYGHTMHPGEVHVPYIAEWDGNEWRELDIPCCGRVADVRTGADRSLHWVTSDKSAGQTLWRRRPDGAIERTRIVLANAGEPGIARAVVWRGADDVWVLARQGTDHVVLHSRARPEVLELRDAAPLDTFATFDESAPCEIVYLPIEAKDELDEMPGRLAVLDGMLADARVELVETRYLGKPGAGLIVRTEEGMAGALASIDVLAGGLGQPVCGEPEIERVIATLVARAEPAPAPGEPGPPLTPPG